MLIWNVAMDKNMVMVEQNKVYQEFMFVVCTSQRPRVIDTMAPILTNPLTEMFSANWFRLVAPYKSALLAIASMDAS